MILVNSCTGVCTRPASGSTEEYCCPGYSGNPPSCISEYNYECQTIIVYCTTETIDCSAHCKAHFSDIQDCVLT